MMKKYVIRDNVTGNTIGPYSTEELADLVAKIGEPGYADILYELTSDGKLADADWEDFL